MEDLYKIQCRIFYSENGGTLEQVLQKGARCPSLKVLETRLDGTLNKQIWLKMSLPLAEEPCWTRWSLRVLSNPNSNSIILWICDSNNKNADDPFYDPSKFLLFHKHHVPYHHLFTQHLTSSLERGGERKICGEGKGWGEPSSLHWWHQLCKDGIHLGITYHSETHECLGPWR